MIFSNITQSPRIQLIIQFSFHANNYIYFMKDVPLKFIMSEFQQRTHTK